MKKTALLLLLVFLLSGCSTLDYRPGVKDLPQKWFDEQPRAQGQVSVINVTKSHSEDILEGPTAVISDRKDWGDDICKMTENALESLGYTVAAGSEKVININVDYVHQYPQFFTTKAILVTQVELGDGTELTVKTDNKSGAHWKRAFYGAAMKAAFEIATHPQVQTYLRQ